MTALIRLRHVVAGESSRESVRAAYASIPDDYRAALMRLRDPAEADLRAVLRAARQRVSGGIVSVSHTARSGVIAYGVGIEALGVDMEPQCTSHAARVPVGEFADMLTAARFERLNPASQGRVFTRLWTMREAYAKALGTGIAGDAGGARLLFDERFEPRVTGWCFAGFQTGSEWVSLAWRGPASVPIRVSGGISRFTHAGAPA